MKRILIALSLSALMGPALAHSQGMKNVEITPVFQTEGRDPVNFNVSCSSTAWTVVATSDTIRRSLLVQTLQSGTTNVCLALSTGTPAGSSCGSSTLGDQMPANASLTYYSKAALYCMTWLNVAANRVTGHANRDRSDYGAINDPQR